MAIWHKAQDKWRPLTPVGYPDESALHALVEEAPQSLPLSGSPQLAVIGREVALGGGWADLVAVESTGRLVVLEVKLSQNAQAKRAIVAQVLSYAAYLRGINRETLESDVLAKHLAERGFTGLASAAQSVDQEGDFDAGSFHDTLDESLSTGHFRLVLVLDDAPEELVRLVGYLEAVGGDLVVDLITVSSLEVDGVKLMTPERVDPERVSRDGASAGKRSRGKDAGYLAEGAGDFLKSIEESPTEHRPDLMRLYQWAKALEEEGLARLQTYHGKGRKTLLPWLRDEGVGLVTIWNETEAGRRPSVSFWRSVFERRAPSSIQAVEHVSGLTLGSGNSTTTFSDELLEALHAAYREAPETTASISSVTP